MTTGENVAVVTGGSAGIGRAICQSLLEQGRAVISIDRTPPSWGHERLIALEVDLSSPAQTEIVAKEITGRHKVTALVNNAGTNLPGSIDSCSLEDLDYLFNLHLKASTILVKSFLDDLRACGAGRIVNISTRAALGRSGRLAYSTTKAGMVGFTRTLALELGQYGVTVNAVAPGPIETNLLRDSNPLGRSPAEIPVRRLGQPEDVARAVSFFLSAESGYITGQLLFVCGGTSIGAYGI